MRPYQGKMQITKNPSVSPSLTKDELCKITALLRLNEKVLVHDMRGGFGNVFIAEDPSLGRFVAVKVLFKNWHPGRLRREWDALKRFCGSKLSNPYLVSIYNSLETEDYFCYVMECADNCVAEGLNYEPDTLGWRIAHAMAEDAPPPAMEEIGELFHKLLDAVQALHCNDLVHLDIKPENILFVNGRPKLGDFSLISNRKIAEGYGGSPGFIPPNQRLFENGGLDGVDQDLYALGKVLYCYTTRKQAREFSEFPKALLVNPFYRNINRFLLRACNALESRRFHNVEEFREGFHACFPRKRASANWLLTGSLTVLLAVGVGMKMYAHYSRQMKEMMESSVWDRSLDSSQKLFEVTSACLPPDIARFRTKKSGSFGFPVKPYQHGSIDVFADSEQSVRHLEDNHGHDSYIFQTARGLVLHLEPRQEITIPVQLELPRQLEFAFFCSGNIPCLVDVQLIRQRKWWRHTDRKLAEIKAEVVDAPFVADFRFMIKWHEKDCELVLTMDGKKVDMQRCSSQSPDVRIFLRFFSEKAGDVSLSLFKLWDISTRK